MRFFLDCNKLPVFRILIKIHKSPVEARPLGASTKSLVVPAAIWVARCLKPVVASACRFVAGSTQDITSAIDDINAAGSQVTKCTAVDINSLYPSIQRDRLMMVVKAAVWQHYRRRTLVEVVSRFLEVILEFQIVQYLDPTSGHTFLYRLVSGLTMGIAPAVHLANLCATVEAADRTCNKCINAQQQLFKIVLKSDQNRGVLALSGPSTPRCLLWRRQSCKKRQPKHRGTTR